MPQENIDIQVNAQTGQAQSNINNLDKVIGGLINEIKQLNQTMTQNVSATNEMGQSINGLGKNIDNSTKSFSSYNQQLNSVLNSLNNSDKNIPKDPTKPLNDSISKTIVGFQGLSGSLKAFGGQTGEFVSSIVEIGYAIDSLSLNPFVLAILSIVSALELMKNSITDTSAGQDEFNAILDVSSFKINNFWEKAIIGIKNFSNDYKQLQSDTAKNSKQIIDETLVSDPNGVITNALKSASKYLSDYQRELGVAGKEIDEFNNAVKISGDFINDQDRDLNATIESINEMKLSYGNLSNEIGKITIRNGQYLFENNSILFKKQQDSLLELKYFLESIILSNGKDIKKLTDQNLESSANIEAYITDNVGLHKYQIQELRIYQKALESFRTKENEMIDVDRKRERLLKRFNQQLIQESQQRQSLFLNNLKELQEKNEDIIENDKQGSIKEHQDKLKLYNDEIKALYKRNEIITEEKLKQADIDKRLGNDPKVAAKAQEVLDKQISDNNEKIIKNTNKSKKENEDWRKSIIKNNMDVILAEDEFAILRSNNDTDLLNSRKKELKDEMSEKIQLLGLTEQQITDLDDESKRNQMIDAGIVNGEMLKEYADYLLKVKALDDKDLKSKEEKEKKEEDLIKKLAEFQKKGLQANEGLMKNTFDWQTKRLDTAKKAVEDNANDQIKVVQETQKKLTDSLNQSYLDQMSAAGNDIVKKQQITTEYLNTKVSLEQSASDQILDIQKKEKEDKKALEQEWIDSKIKGFDTLTGAVEDWNNVLKGSANVSKAIEEGQAVINTLGAANKALNAKYSGEGITDMTLRIAAVAATLANGYAQVKKISETPSGGGGGNTSIPSMPTAPNMFAVGQGQINNPVQFANNRVQVVESDITSTQNRVRVVESQSVLGG